MADEQGRIVVGHVDSGAVHVALLGQVVDLRHVSAAVDAEAAKLCLVRAWLFDLEQWDTRPLDDGTGLDEPA
ncbi:RNA polymerase II protein [Pyrenophora tritici-repentis]|nr:RNA polymerase II subunit A C-terminal domain phosphatase [Pyrenophora tritici-repentis]KAF7455510.1 RNA polymerase II protein [Pyrenophora tritici-repentis]KAG9389261.1 RNA polymerase II protein [Pyrenophora tritici-repentis]